MITGIALAVLALFLLSILIYAAGFIVSTAKREEVKYVYALIPIALVLVAATSWIVLFDWQRVIYSVFMLPLVHSAAFLLVCAFSMKNQSCKKVRILVISLWVTYILPYLFLPKEDEFSNPQMLFGTVEGKDLTAFSALAKVLFLVNVSVLILLTVKNVLSRKKQYPKKKTSVNKNGV